MDPTRGLPQSSKGDVQVGGGCDNVLAGDDERVKKICGAWARKLWDDSPHSEYAGKRGEQPSHFTGCKYRVKIMHLWFLGGNKSFRWLSSVEVRTCLQARVAKALPNLVCLATRKRTEFPPTRTTTTQTPTLRRAVLRQGGSSWQVTHCGDLKRFPSREQKRKKKHKYATQSPLTFHWTYLDEEHGGRIRQEIVKKRTKRLLIGASEKKNTGATGEASH